MSAGELRHRVTLLECRPADGTAAAPLTDEDGYRIVDNWLPVAEVWAAVRNRYGREWFEAKAVNRERDVVFRIRYRPGVLEGMRARFDGREYDIQYVDHVRYERAYIEFAAQEIPTLERGG